MSNRGAGVGDATVPPKLNGRSEAGDPLDTAAQQTLDLLHRAAVAAEANNQQAIEVADKLSAQLRAAEDRTRELEARSAITMTGQTGRRSGWIKSRWRFSGIFLEATLIGRHSHLLHRRSHETSRDSSLRIALVRSATILKKPFA